MLRYLTGRILGLLPTLLVIVTLSFLILRLAPGGPFDQEQGLSPQVRANLDRAYGLDQSLPVQYAHYLRGLLHGDFGPSLRQRDFTVRELIAQGLPVSLTLGLAALLLALAVGIPAGIAAALWQGRAPDHLLSGFAACALALPSFVVGPLLALVFALHLHWLPVAGWQHGMPRYLVLPAITLGLPMAAYLARLMRASLIETLRSAYVRSARARGLGAASVLWHHALPPALLPVVSYLGPAIAFVVTGSLVVESVFGLPGTGRYLVQGAIDRDYPLVLGMVVVYGTLTLVLNCLADLLYGALDPAVHHA
ncbi:MAG: ABC transporter permease subunit [Proteobacteria bacterium]|nr:ABC transporter permease subunit [Pseudomonadota bacterium]